MKKLTWDSNFFGFDVYQLNYTNTLKLPKGFFYIKGKFNDLEKIDTQNFTSNYLDEKIIFEKKITSLSNIDVPKDYSFKEIDEVDTTLTSLARLSGEFSRFKQDITLQPYFNKFYDLWIYNSVYKSFADVVLGYYFLDNLLGFVSIKLYDTYGQIGLIAVDPLSQGKGVGKRLILAAENYVFNKNIHYLKIPTQLKNKKACNFYKHQNYTAVQKEYLLQINNL